MVLLNVKNPRGHRATFWLALEEWAARHKTLPLPAFTMWQVEPTVVFGRNQQVDLEVNLEYCRQNDINIVRRKSGGGCIYADKDNLMTGCVSASTDVKQSFAEHTERIAALLRAMGVAAECSSRNDVTVEGRKISGNSYYGIGNRAIVHGTLLLDFNTTHMANAITPSRAKLSSKGVKSVPARLTTLHEYLPDLTVEDIRKAAIATFIDDVYTLSPADEQQVLAIEAEYTKHEWVYRSRCIAADHVRIIRFDEVGEIRASLCIADNVITDVVFDGDFFDIAPLSGLTHPLRGIPFTRQAITETVDSLNPGDVIAGLTRRQLVELINPESNQTL